MMNRSRWFLLVIAIIFSTVPAFFLRDAIYQMVVLPLAYLGWLLGFYYSLIPQLFLWTLLLIGLFAIILSNFTPAARPGRRKELKRKTPQGQVETMAMWLVRSNKGNYFKWQIANRLGRIGRELAEMSGKQSRPEIQNEAVKNYLDAGLNTSFVDYPRPVMFRHPTPTPLDLDPKEVVDYLESQVVGREPATLEDSSGRHP